ncbi:ABC transporter substrate-binding protein [Ramlibacter rhizophilus]|uniref:ABC transporter substrate-binding protein n=1 Tax=Ramlibacter rhizophilus TaxID=1781167 RepID=A0A4Z0BPG4_9BURK|nr:helical backbone metal receptor [Ramlibacter rhizophilus]TFZ01197.1 ABC transporter substrate-binding protein [Ramlibacter rhizophilus]
MACSASAAALPGRPCRAAGRALLLLLFACLAPLAWAAPVQVSDDRGRVLRWDEPPRRIVSLLPSLTESLCALGECARLVGVDRYSNWPAAVQALPRLGGGIDPQVEAVLALRPDAVLLAQSSQAVQRLEALGLKVVVLEPRTHADARRVLATLAQLAGRPVQDAERLWQAIESEVDAAARSLPPGARRARVYFEASRGPYGAGPPSFIGETLARLGVRNVLPAALGPFPRLNPEYVVRADPDVIMIGRRNAEGLAQRPGWAGMRALREQRLCVFDDDQADLLVRPGPRLGEAAATMARCLRDKAP